VLLRGPLYKRQATGKDGVPGCTTAPLAAPGMNLQSHSRARALTPSRSWYRFTGLESIEGLVHLNTCNWTSCPRLLRMAVWRPVEGSNRVPLICEISAIPVKSMRNLLLIKWKMNCRYYIQRKTYFKTNNCHKDKRHHFTAAGNYIQNFQGTCYSVDCSAHRTKPTTQVVLIYIKMYLQKINQKERQIKSVTINTNTRLYRSTGPF
jgi:hypothetical protein